MVVFGPAQRALEKKTVDLGAPCTFFLGKNENALRGFWCSFGAPWGLSGALGALFAFLGGPRELPFRPLGAFRPLKRAFQKVARGFGEALFRSDVRIS